MKLLRVTSVKNSTLCNYLNRNICNIKLSYQETIHSIGMDLPHSLLLSQVFGEFGINTLDVIHDLDLLQEKWFKENGLNVPKCRVNCLYKQIEFFKPVILYFQDLDSLPIVEFEKLKINFPFVRSIVIFKGSYIALLPNCFDLVITCTPNLLQHYKNQGFKTKLVYHGYDDRFESCYSNTFTTNFSFIGSTGYGFGTTHSTRFITLQYLLEHTDIRIWSNEQIHDRSHNIHYLLNDKYINWLKKCLYKLPSSFIIILAQLLRLNNLTSDYQAFCLAKNYFPVLGIRVLETLVNDDVLNTSLKHYAMIYIYNYRKCIEPGLFEPISAENKTFRIDSRQPWYPLGKLYPHRCNPPVWGKEMYKALSKSRITFNIHGDYIQGSVGNMRLFEATGMGSCLLTEYSPNLKELFNIDSEIVTYTSKEDCVEKYKYLATNRKFTESIALAGRKRTLKDHTLKARCYEIYKHIDKAV